MSKSQRQAEPPHALIWCGVLLITALLVAGRWIPSEAERQAMYSLQMQLAIFQRAIEDYRADLCERPATLEDIVRDPGLSGWRGPYIYGETLPMDAWGNEFHYQRSPDPTLGYRVFSSGPDGSPGTGDDIFYAGPPQLRK